MKKIDYKVNLKEGIAVQGDLLKIIKEVCSEFCAQAEKQTIYEIDKLKESTLELQNDMIKAIKMEFDRKEITEKRRDPIIQNLLMRRLQLPLKELADRYQQEGTSNKVKILEEKIKQIENLKNQKVEKQIFTTINPQQILEI